MPRWIASIIAAFVLAMPLLALYKPADEQGNDRAAQFKKIQADYEKVVPDVAKAYQTAETAKEKETILAKLNKDFAPRIIKLVEADPKDQLSFGMLMWTVQALPKPDRKVFDLLAKHWAKEKKIKLLCQRLMFDPQAGAEKLLQTVLDENGDKETQGFACFALAKLASEQAGEGDKKAEQQAEKYYERVVKDFGKLKFGEEGTFGEEAKAALFEIRYLLVGKSAPNVSSNPLDGKKGELKDYKGKVVVLDIWATWCGPCKSMIPHELEMVKKHKKDPFALISVSADDEKETLAKFLKDNEMPWVHWWDGEKGNIVKGWNVKAFPTIYVLDAKGVIRYKFLGVVTEELDDAVEKLLAEVKDKK